LVLVLLKDFGFGFLKENWIVGFLRILIQTYNPSHCSAIGTIPDYDERLHLIFGKLPLKEIRRITYQKGKE
jgi:hypothetical protein